MLLHGWAVSSYLWRHNIGALGEGLDRADVLQADGRGAVVRGLRSIVAAPQACTSAHGCQRGTHRTGVEEARGHDDQLVASWLAE